MKRLIIYTISFLLSADLFSLYIMTSGEAEWLTLETPASAVTGQPFTIKVILRRPEPGRYLGADLHWMDEKKNSHGYLSGVRSVEITAGKTVYELRPEVPLSSSASFIFPVVVVSADGTWGGRIYAADAEPSAVISGSGTGISNPMVRRRGRDIMRENHMAEPESCALRYLTAGLWLSAAAVCAAFYRNRNGVLVITTALASSAWELLNAGTVAGGIFRQIALISDTYSFRRGPQQALSVIVITCLWAAGLYIISRVREKELRVLWLALSLFWGISLLGLFSLHEIDFILSASAAGMQAGQAIRFCASGVCLAAAVLIIRKKVRADME